MLNDANRLITNIVLFIAGGAFLLTSGPASLQYVREGAIRSGRLSFDPWGLLGLLLLVSAVAGIYKMAHARHHQTP